MTTPETAPTHRSRIKPGAIRRWTWNIVIVCVLAMLGAVGYLFQEQREFQSCVADYTASDAKARDIRSVSSASTINALVKQSEALTAALARSPIPATPEQREAALAAIAAVPPASQKYNHDIEMNPYPKYTCGGVK